MRALKKICDQDASQDALVATGTSFIEPFSGVVGTYINK